MSFQLKNPKVKDLFGRDAQIVSIATEIVTCRGAAARMESLRCDLGRMDSKAKVHLRAALRGVGVPETLQRRCVSAFAQRVQRAVAVFVQQRLAGELHARASARTRGAHAFAANLFMTKMEPACVECFARATAASNVASGTSANAESRTALLATVERLWTQECLPFVETEKRAARADAEDLAKLLRFLDLVRRQPDEAAKTAAWERHFDAVAHVSQRVRESAWYASSSCLWPLDRAPADRARWLEARGGACAAALAADQRALLTISRSDVTDRLWVGLSLKESIDTPQEGFMLLPPSHLNGFDSSTKRLFVVPDPVAEDGGGARARRQWRLLPVQMVWVLREMLARDWFPVSGLSARFAESIVAAECNELTDKVVELLELLAELVDVGSSELEEALELLSDEISGALFPPPQPTEESAASASAGVATPTPTTPPTLSSSWQCLDRDQLWFCPLRVSSALVVDYVVVHAAHAFVARSIRQSRLRGVASRVFVSMAELAATVATVLRSRTVVGEIDVATLNQVVPRLTNRLVDFGERCCARNLILDASNVEWYAQVVGLRKKELVVGKGSFDRACDAFCRVCALLKCHFDENHPLPGGLEWSARRRR